jgi:hypothetical protein
MIFMQGMNQSVSSTLQLYTESYVHSNYTNMPPCISYNKTEKPVDEILNFFSDMVYFTKEEKKKYREAVDRLYTPTGDKLF